MTTLLDKVSVLVSANLHALVDQALKANSLAVIDQFIRQAEDNLENLADAAATVGGEIKSLRRKVNDYEKKAKDLDRTIDVFITNNNENAAAAAQSQLNGISQLVENYNLQISTQEAEYQKLLDAKVKLEARLATMKQQRTELQSLLELAKSKEIVVKTVKNLDALMGSGDSDVSRIAQSIYARLDKASAATEMRTASLDEQIDQVLGRELINQQLAERKKRLNPPQ
jgi:phage shock protein A